MPTEKSQQLEKAIVEYVPFGSDSKIKLNATIVKELICVPTKSGKLCSEKDAIKFMAMCHARKLNPFEGDAFLLGYDGKDGPTFSLITAHQAFLKRAEVNEEYDGMESGVVVQSADGTVVQDIQGDFTTAGQKVVGGWARVYFKTRKYPMYKRIRLSRFKKNFGVWLDDEAGMICKCAEADALRSSFPTMLGGLYLREEREPQTINIVDAKVETVAESGDRMRAALDRRETISNGRDANSAPTGEQTPPANPTTPQEAAPKPPAQPVRKQSPKLKPKEPEPEPQPSGELTHRQILNNFLAVKGYTEDQFLQVACKNDWLGKGRKWDNMNDVPDEMLEVFLDPQEQKTLLEQLEKLPRHTKD